MMDEKMEKAWIAAASACVEVIDGEHQYVAPVSPEQWERALNAAFDAARQPPAEAQAQGGGEFDKVIEDALRCGTGMLRVEHVPQAEFTALPSAPVGVDVQQALDAVNDAANAARHARDYTVANALVKARITLYRAALAQQPAAVDDEENRDTWRALWLVLRQTGTVTVTHHEIVSADWSRCQIEQTEHEMTGTVRLRATLLDAQPGGSDNDR